MKAAIKVIVAKPGLDGHDRGAKVVSRALRDAGMEVIYMGLHNLPEQIVECALQEDADVIGLSILSGAHNNIVSRIFKILQEKKMEKIAVVIGGIIPDDDIPYLLDLGVKGVFTPGTNMNKIVDVIRQSVEL
ncbi:MAG: cobalamin B12-binding domain-containing protein [Phascolarctobacterium sp.]|uniref:cobalamin B12-binding domain-containing protein n=1 Tax=Phascolarctobacterium sp. TaxID=2049039 RepID=UPI0025DF777A|nr:cobalamin B12-binding domain-containing protein [Phascolarctobacterium sp.]MCC8159570.1 cobalamin B12-binding domain-containing protein [Phascolarctobacterium sp.]